MLRILARIASASLGLTLLVHCGAESAVPPTAASAAPVKADTPYCGSSYESGGFEVTVGPALDLCCEGNDIVRVGPLPPGHVPSGGASSSDYVVVFCETPRHDLKVVPKSSVAALLAPTSEAIVHSAVFGPAIAPSAVEALEIVPLLPESKSPFDGTWPEAEPPRAGAPEPMHVGSSAPLRTTALVQRLVTGLVANTAGFVIRKKNVQSWVGVQWSELKDMEGPALLAAKETIKANSDSLVVGIQLGPHGWLTFKDPAIDLGVASRVVTGAGLKVAVQAGGATYALGGTWNASTWQVSVGGGGRLAP